MSHQVFDHYLENEQAALHVLEQALGYTYQAALRAAVELGVADALAHGETKIDELANRIQADPQKLHRVLRLLATRGIFQEIRPGIYALTPAADFLRSDVAYSLRSAVLMLTDETFWRPIGRLADSVQGKPPFKQIFGATFFEHWHQASAQTEDFHVGMSSMSDLENLFLIRNYIFPERALVADIAGGFGGLLLRVLQANPGLNGILFEQAHVLERHRLNELNDQGRWQLQTGDFFDSVPKADIYLLKYIMHDWPDDKAILILENCRRAMNSGGKILIIDPVIPEGNTPHPGKELDLIIMGILDGGREKTRSEFESMLAQAGLCLNKIIDTGSHLSIIEAGIAD